MSLVDRVNEVKQFTTEAYTKLEAKQATIPKQKNLQNLSSAIDSIETDTNNGMGKVAAYTYINSDYLTASLMIKKLNLKGSVLMDSDNSGKVFPSFKFFPNLEELNLNDFNFGSYNVYISESTWKYGILSYKLKTLMIDNLDFKKCSHISNFFPQTSTLKNIVGSFKNIGAYEDSQGEQPTLDLSYCYNLTHDSLLNLINGLATLTTKYEFDYGEFIIGTTNLKRLSQAEKNMITEKKWTYQ